VSGDTSKIMSSSFSFQVHFELAVITPTQSIWNIRRCYANSLALEMLCALTRVLKVC